MNYAIEILEKESVILKECLKGWKPENYPEAFKERNRKLKEIEKAIQTLISKQALIELTNME
jgi:hypothetical protein